jgi:hypothetical protein
MAKNKKRKIKSLQEQQEAGEPVIRRRRPSVIDKSLENISAKEISAQEEKLGRPLTQLEINAIRARVKEKILADRAELRRKMGIEEPVAPATGAPVRRGAGDRPMGEKPQRVPGEPKIQITSGSPQTPRLQILKSPEGKYTITYGKSDPLGLRTELSTGIDGEIQRLFGYGGWQEYKNYNMRDLKKSIKTDKSGKIAQAPTVHPFHVAYGLEEFTKNFDVNEYEIVGVPAEMLNIEVPLHEDLGEKIGANIAKMKKKISAKRDLKKLFTLLNIVLKMRKNFFGDNTADSGTLAYNGILNQAMFDPQEKLLNKDVIKRVKQQFNFDKIFAKKFTGNLPVKHIVGKYWKGRPGEEQTFNDVTDNLDEILVVDVQGAMRDSSLLKEAQVRAAMDLIEDWTGDLFDEDTWVWIHGAWFAFQVGDPSPWSAVPDAVVALGYTVTDPTASNMAALGFASLAMIPYIGDVAKITDKVNELRQGAEVISKTLISRGGDAAEVGKKLQQAGEVVGQTGKPSARQVRELADTMEEASEIIKNTPITGPGASRAYVSARKQANETLGNKLDEAAEGLRGTISPRGDITIKGVKYKAGVAGTQAVGEFGHEYYLGVREPDEQLVIAPEETHNIGIAAEDLPDTPISISKLKFYILPKNWRRGAWLTETENVLSLRVGANTSFPGGRTGQASPTKAPTTARASVEQPPLYVPHTGVTPHKTVAGAFEAAQMKNLTALARANNIKYFGNAGARGGGEWKSSIDNTRKYNRSLNYTLGSIPYVGSTDGRRKATIHPEWRKDNLVYIDTPIINLLNGRPRALANKHIASPLLSAIQESREKYGLPLGHMGAMYTTGNKEGFSSHAWGAAIDLDAPVNPYTAGGRLSRSRTLAAIKNNKGYYKRYWNFKNSSGKTYLEYLKESYDKKEYAMSLYEFVAGPLENNGIANIFAKYGFFAGMQYNTTRKDIMHFEFIPDLVKRRQEPEVVSERKENKFLNELIKMIQDIENNELV